MGRKKTNRLASQARKRGRDYIFAALLSSVAPMAVATWPMEAGAQSQVIAFDIPAQPVAPALVAFAKQADLRLVMSEEPSGGVQANAVRGVFERDQALAMLVEGTGYRARVEGDAIRIWRASERGPNDRRSERSLDDGAIEPQLNDAETSQRGRYAQAEDIVVVGTNIRGAGRLASPVEIYSAEDIARSSAVTTEQFVQRLSQNVGSRTEFAASTILNQPNTEGTTSLDLRGLGVGTTLTLVNGRRLGLVDAGRAADVSVIPLSAIERVEVLTDGASAIYGSDAIGGVVNFVLRDSLDGLEFQTRYGGVLNGGMRRGGLGIAAGTQWRFGHGMLAYDFSGASALQREDRGYAAVAGPGTLTPHDERHSVLGAFEHALTDRFQLEGSVLFAERSVKNDGADLTASNTLSHVFFTGRSETRQQVLSIGANWRATDAIQTRLWATFAHADVESEVTGDFFNFGFVSSARRDQEYQSIDLSWIADGELLSLPGGHSRFSVGANFVREDYTGLRADGGVVSGDLARETTAAFAELMVPIVGAQNRLPLIDALSLSVAGRYTRHVDASEPSLGRDFGDRISPKFGLRWDISPSLSARATLSESFRAPALSEVDPTAAVNRIRANFPIASTPATVLILQGPSPELEPETSESFTVGVDYRLTSRFRLSATFFAIEYSDRIAQGDLTLGAAPAANPAAWPDVIFKPNSAEQIQLLLSGSRNTLNTSGISLSDLNEASAAFYSLPEFWILDLRHRNIARSNVEGIDFSANGSLRVASAEVFFGVHLTQMLSYSQRVSGNAPEFDYLGVVTQPADRRGRAYVGGRWAGLDLTLSLNHVSDFANPFAVGGEQRVDSWNTIDVAAAYDWGGAASFTLSVQNVFDESPPMVARGTGGPSINFPVGFDPVNANPLGTVVTLGLRGRW